MYILYRGIHEKTINSRELQKGIIFELAKVHPDIWAYTVDFPHRGEVLTSVFSFFDQNKMHYKKCSRWCIPHFKPTISSTPARLLCMSGLVQTRR